MLEDGKDSGIVQYHIKLTGQPFIEYDTVDSGLGLWSILTMFSALGLACTVFTGRRKKRQ